MPRTAHRVVVLALALAATIAANAGAAGYGCSSSAGRLIVLGHATEPVTANAGASSCTGKTSSVSGPDVDLPTPVGASALVAATQVYPEQKSVLAQGGVADLRVLSLPSLPITLPLAAVPDPAKALIGNVLKVTVDLTAVKALLPVLPTNLVTDLLATLPTDLVTDLATNLVTTTSTTLTAVLGPVPLLPTNLRVDLPTALPVTLPTDLPTNFAVNPDDPALDTPAEVSAANAANATANAANAAVNTADTDANAANAAANAANTTANALNGVVNALGGTITGANLASALVAIPAANAANAAANAANAAANAANTAANAAAVTANAANAVANVSNAALNAAHVVTNAANTALNAVRSAIPDSVSIDGSGGLDAALAALLPDGRLPTAELLQVKGAMAYAAGSCQSGSGAVSGSSTVSGIKVLGQSLPADQAVDRLVTLIDTAFIDPSAIALPGMDLGLTQAQKDLIASIPLAAGALDSALNTARTTIQGALDALDKVKVLDPTVARIKVTPGQQVKSGATITQQALTVAITIAGQELVDAVVGEAKASAAGVFCDDSGVDSSTPGAPGNVIKVPGIKGPVDTSTPAGATLQCSTRRLVLVDVLERAGRVKLFGVADPALAGRTVSIVFAATHGVVAHARIAKDGSFDTTAPLPSAAVRDTNAARYTAVLGKDESINLKLRRRMVITSTGSRKGYVTIAGRVVGPLGVPRQPITLTRRVSCTKDSVVKAFRPGADGRFRITVKAPKGLGTAVYRMTTKVRNSPRGHALFTTYTLPRAVDLQR